MTSNKMLNGVIVQLTNSDIIEIEESKALWVSKAGERARAERDALLTASDWTQVADAPVDTAAWATYRQALRDIPSQSGFPDNITWPQEPTT